jgi:hypothetical protein
MNQSIAHISASSRLIPALASGASLPNDHKIKVSFSLSNKVRPIVMPSKCIRSRTQHKQ